MAQLQQTEVIDGISFTVSQLPSRRAVKLSWRLGKIAGPGAMQLLQAAMGGEVAAAAAGKPSRGAGIAAVVERLGKMDVVNLGPMVEGLFDRMKEEDVDWLMKELLENALIGDAPLWGQFDLAMQGKLTTVYKLLWFALRVQFQNFGDGHPAGPSR